MASSRDAKRAAAALALSLSFAPSQAADGLFEGLTGVDLDRHVWMKPDPCGDGPSPGNSFAPGASGAACPHDAISDSSRVSAGFGWTYRDLLDRNGDPAFTQRQQGAFLDLRARPVDRLEARFSAERDDRDLDYADSSLRVGVNPAGRWNFRGSLALRVRAWLVPVLSGGFDPEGGREAALAWTGGLRGFSWNAQGGFRSLEYPLELKLPDYEALSIPLLSRQKFAALALAWKGEKAEAFWGGRLRRDEHPDRFTDRYSLSDSGRTVEQTAGAAWNDSARGARYRASLEGEYMEGENTFRGTRSGSSLYQFAYEETRHRDTWVRADLSVRLPRWEAGVFAGASALQWDALRPAVASGRYFWDRNGVLDSYQGGLLGVFSSETWLFDGNAAYAQRSAGGWFALIRRNWRAQAGAALQSVSLSARGDLTKRTSELIVSSTEKNYSLDFQGLDATLLTPEIRASARFGAAVVKIYAAQAVPLSARLRGGGAANGTGLSSSRYAGGTQLRIAVERGFF